MSRKSVRRSLAMTPEMHDRLAQLVRKEPRTETQDQRIRAIGRCHWFVHQAIVHNSRRYCANLTK
jgi:hypothetical protein